MSGPFKMKYNKSSFPYKTDPKELLKKQKEEDPGNKYDPAADEESDVVLKDQRSNDKNVDLDRGENMPVKGSGFGPRANTNLGNLMMQEPEDKME